MTTPRTVVLAALAVLALVVAQDVVPASSLFHDWRYAAALTLVAIPLVRAAWPRRGFDRRLALAALGGLIVAGAGLWSGLAGADTETITGAPGATVPVPSLHLSAQFGAVSDAELAAGTAPLTLRRDGETLDIGTHPRVLGGNVFYAQPHVAARIEARDGRGNRLTVTQPQNATFLSDVLLFRTEQPIHDQRIPLDTFATPAQHRVIRALYFTGAELAAFRKGSAADAAALVLSAADDAGRPLGIALAPSGVPVRIAGITVRAVLGRYPVLAVASGPQPAAVVAGTVLLAAAFVWRLLAARRVPQPVLDADLT